ncbi:MAG: tyrosine-type recombinase/integrase [Gemmatimonadota bacterium]
MKKARKTKPHPGTIEDRGAYLRVILYVASKRHAYRLNHKDRKAAEKFAREKHGELEKQQARVAQGLPGSTTFSELLDQYKRDELPTLSEGTQRAYKDTFQPVMDYFVDQLRNPTLERIHAKHIRGYLAWRRTQRRAGKNQTAGTQPLSNRTLQKDRAVLHRIFEFADELELREGNPVARVEAPKADGRSPILLSDDQYEALLKECEPRPMLWLYTLVMGETGGRCLSEVLMLQWQDVDLAEGFIEIRSGREGHRTKSGKSRYVPMTPRLLAAMREHFAKYRFLLSSPWVFHHLTTRRGCKAGERIRSLRATFDKAASKAGIPDSFHRHDLRHRRVTTWLAGGANPVHVKEAMGHSDLRTTMGYTHLAKEHLRALVAPISPADNPTSLAAM